MADLNRLGGLHYEMMKRCYDPNSITVSYTHLDVYKRQDRLCETSEPAIPVFICRRSFG